MPSLRFISRLINGKTDEGKRRLLWTAPAILVAPAVVSAASLMPVRSIVANLSDDTSWKNPDWLLPSDVEGEMQALHADPFGWFDREVRSMLMSGVKQ